MAKTSNDVCAEALRLIGVVAEDEAMTADAQARAYAHMVDIFATLNNTEGLAFEWTVETVPDGAFLPFARAIAGSVASSYGASEAAAIAAAMIDPQKSIYEIGMDGIRRFAAPDMSHRDDTTIATYF